MIATILTFAMSLLFLTSFLGYQIFRLRRGEVVAQNHDFSHHFLPKPEELNRHINPIKKDVIEYAKKHGHEAVLTAIRSWFKAVYFIRRKKDELLPKIKALMPKRHHEIKQPAVVSEFLRSISEYKTKLKHIKDKIKEEEKQNF